VTDSLSRQASCSFKVVLRGFSIGVTKYEAVGDSLTEGENGLPAQITSFVDTSNSYPVQLQLDFDTDFPNQGVLVINRGHSGDPVELTVSELPSLLSADRPDAVLVLSGYNNLLTGGCSAGDQVGGECESAIRGVEFGIRDCIRRIKESPLGIKYIYVSTLTPPGPYLGGVKDRRINANAIVEANAAIRQTVASEGATLVDGYGAFLGHEADYIEPDGLHPRPAGYKALADAFFAAITATIPQTPLFRGSDLDFLR
jgi:lysophospholipase L1-like esterase